MNDSNTMLVVSDRFANLCSIDGVIAYSTLIGHLLRKDRDLTQKRFVITQGFSLPKLRPCKTPGTAPRYRARSMSLRIGLSSISRAMSTLGIS